MAHVRLKRRSISTRLHGEITQKTVTFARTQIPIDIHLFLLSLPGNVSVRTEPGALLDRQSVGTCRVLHMRQCDSRESEVHTSGQQSRGGDEAHQDLQAASEVNGEQHFFFTKHFSSVSMVHQNPSKHPPPPEC